ncbi:P-loop NTPase fold protein [Methanosarcina sp. DH2]|uniref:P-loop NTPase fold protein n=1 Tax=Methanosarcina sp. DH2 TaxID=2605639 RepID=UPI001E61ACAE|nr:P-loop NTPase fold protein [Methanosarcina sp. DH2]
MPDSKSKLILECWNDVSTEEDSLGFRPYVEAIIEFLTADGTRPPITLSIEGQWGCGKSPFMRQLQREINKKIEQKKNQNILLYGSTAGDMKKKMSYGLLLHFV